MVHIPSLVSATSRFSVSITDKRFIENAVQMVPRDMASAMLRFCLGHLIVCNTGVTDMRDLRTALLRRR
jgi:hypothetical protein